MDVSKTIQQRVLIITAFTGALGVILGAFGAHGMEKSSISVPLLSAYHTAVLYHMLHVMALGIAVLAAPLITGRFWRLSIAFFFSGIFLFSGSLYAMGLADAAGSDLSFLGPVTPLGGLCLILGWLFLGTGAWKAINK